MRTRGRSGLVLGLIGFLGSVAAAVPPQDAAELVPDDVLGFAGWSRLNDGQWELLKMLEAALRSPLLVKEMGNDHAMASRAMEMVATMTRHTGALCVFAPPEPGGAPQFGLCVNAGSDAEGLNALYTEIMSRTGGKGNGDTVSEQSVGDATLRRAGDRPVLWGAREGYFLTVSNAELAARMLGCVDKSGKSLAQSADYQQCVAKTSPAPADWYLTAYVALPKLLALIPPSAVDGSEPDPQTILRALGAYELRGLYARLDRIEYGTRLSAYCPTAGSARGVLKLYEQRPLSDTDFALLPHDAYFGVVGNLDLRALWEAALATLEEIGPELRMQVEGAVATSTQLLGFSLTDELLPAFGDTWAIFDAPSQGGVLFTGWVLVGEVQDVDALRGMLARTIQFLTPLAAQGEVKLTSAEMKAGDRTIHYVLIGGFPVPVAPAWTFVGDHWIFGLAPQTVAVAAEHVDPRTRKRSLLDVPEFRTARALLPEKLTSLSYIDAQHGSRLWYGLELLAKTAVASLSAGTPQAYDLGRMPTFPQRSPNLPPMFAAYGSAPDGIVYRAVGVSPEALITSFNPGSLGSAAFAASILLPSVSRSRELTKRAVSAANLRSLGQACFVYANDNADRFPPDLKTLVAAGLLTANVVQSPRLGELPDGGYLYIAGQTTDASPRNVLAYERVIDPDGTNVLFLDGHVEWLPLPEFQEAVRATYERLGRSAEMPENFGGP